MARFQRKLADEMKKKVWDIHDAPKSKPKPPTLPPDQQKQTTEMDQRLKYLNEKED